ncbi:Inositol polyphosphate multikinase [Liparis tanakae]|uniref:Kinase n=1 Tax=Liparis tanakae TaxID=230148 RepID=A0A4Z2G7Q0_9TELE|nr:Inositol polyphosphate multikinase [Liparis tanakae]
MDVKLGQRSYDPFASQEKREQQIRKYPLMEEIGFLVLGMRVYKMCSDTFDSYDQHYGRGLGPDSIKDGLANFFHNGVRLRKDAVSSSIHRVQCILRWFESQQQMVFYASSLLFVYEGLPSSSSSSSLSSLLSSPSVSPTAADTATLSSPGGEGRARPGEAEEVAEYNNNNIRVAAPWDCSLASIYTNHTKEGHHRRCARGRLRGNGDTGGTPACPELSALCGEDNSAWKRTEAPPNGNGNKSQLEGEEEDGGGVRREEQQEEEEEEEELKGRGTEGSGEEEEEEEEEVEVEVRMIDFAHVFPNESHDHGYIYGLKHLLTVLEQILCDAA